MGKTTVLIADDQVLFRSGLKELLKEDDELEVVAEASNGEEAVQLAIDLKPDVIIMDVVMPGINGIEAAKQIMETVPTSSILMLSAYNYESYILASLRNKVAGFLYKGIEISELKTAIGNIRAGKHVIDQDAAFNIITSMISHKNENSSQSNHQLHDREIEVLKHAAKGMTNREIAFKMELSEHTVQVHMTNIFRKLNVHSRTEAIFYAMKQGWVSLEEIK